MGALKARLVAPFRPRFVHTTARSECPACPHLSYADRSHRLYWSGIRPHWPLLSIGVPSGGAWFEPSTAHLTKALLRRGFLVSEDWRTTDRKVGRGNELATLAITATED